MPLLCSSEAFLPQSRADCGQANDSRGRLTFWTLASDPAWTGTAGGGGRSARALEIGSEESESSSEQGLPVIGSRDDGQEGEPSIVQDTVGKRGDKPRVRMTEGPGEPERGTQEQAI